MMDPHTDPARQVIDLTRSLLQYHYCDNNMDAIIQLLDPEIVWLGTAEHEYAAGRETVAGIFRQFAGLVPRCNLSGEEYQVLEMGPDLYLCAGRVWISTDASTGISLRVHQRFSFLFRQQEGRLLCCHIHISNPYEEMQEGEVGFPHKMGQQSTLYLQEQLALQTKKIAQQTALLERLSYEDALTGVYNRNKYNEMLTSGWEKDKPHLGIICFDLNGLKRANDLFGHSMGDELICRTADQIRLEFAGKIYRIGGDEFVVIDDERDHAAFRASVLAVELSMAQNGISCSVGTSWHAAPCNVRAQVEEADSRMYHNKRCFYDKMSDKDFRD